MRTTAAIVVFGLLVATPLWGQQRAISADSLVPVAPIHSLSELLTARVPGVQVLSQDGSAGAGPVVVVRGYAGGADVSRPLLIVDGIRVDNSGGSGAAIPPLSYHPATARFDDLDPSDIASVEVLPGAVAASLYGPGAGNGVILVTTKRTRAAKLSGDLTVEGGIVTTAASAPQSYFSWGHVGNQTAQCPLDASTTGLCTLDSVTHYNPLAAGGAESPFHTAYLQRYQGSLGATFGSQSLSVSGGYLDEPGTLVMPSADAALYAKDFGAPPLPGQRYPSDVNRGQLRGSFISRLSSAADVVVTAAYSGTHQRDAAIDSFLSDAALGTGSRTLFDGWFSPVNRPEFDFGEVATDHTQHLMWNARGEWRLSPQLALHATVGTDAVRRTTADRRVDAPRVGTDTIIGNDQQRLTQYTADAGGTWTARLTLTVESRTSAGLQYLAANASDTVDVVPLGHSAIRLSDLTQSAYLDEGLSIAQVVSLDARVRWDHHRLQTDRVSSSAAYPALSASWAILGTTADPRLRVRGGIGETSTAIGTQQLAALALPLQTTVTQFKPAVRQRDLEAGIDAALPHDVASVSVTTYARRTVHALLPVSVANNVGGVDRFIDQGTVSDRGLEFSASVRPTPVWDATLSAFEHWNKALRLPFTQVWYGGMLRNETGHPLYGIWAAPYTFADANHDGVIEANEVTELPSVYVGSSVPTHEASLATAIHLLHRSLHIATLFDYRGGYVLPDQNGFYQSAVLETRAQNIPGASLADQALAMAVQAGPGWPMGYVQRVSAVRWRELSATTAVPGHESVRLTLAVRNLALWTNYRGGDPDVSIGEQPATVASVAPALQLPQPRTWVLRLSAAF